MASLITLPNSFYSKKLKVETPTYALSKEIQSVLATKAVEVKSV